MCVRRQAACPLGGPTRLVKLLLTTGNGAPDSLKSSKKKRPPVQWAHRQAPPKASPTPGSAAMCYATVPAARFNGGLSCFAGTWSGTSWITPRAPGAGPVETETKSSAVPGDFFRRVEHCTSRGRQGLLPFCSCTAIGAAWSWEPPARGASARTSHLRPRAAGAWRGGSGRGRRDCRLFPRRDRGAGPGARGRPGAGRASRAIRWAACWLLAELAGRLSAAVRGLFLIDPMHVTGADAPARLWPITPPHRSGCFRRDLEALLPALVLRPHV